MKRRVPFFAALCLLIAVCVFALPQQAQAASSEDLSFTLNEDGESYCVSDCYQPANGELVIPSTYNDKPVTGIGDYAFQYCFSLTSVTIPDSVTAIGKYAFNYCIGLTSVTIPDSVTAIGKYAFSDCTGLTSVTIPDSVASIGEGPFSSCSKLTGIWVDANNVAYSSDEDGVLYNKDRTELIQCPGGYTGNYTIPNSVTSIGGYAFSECRSLAGVTIPDSITGIGWHAFAGCESLTGVTIGARVTTIGLSAFSGCSNLTSVSIPKSVIWIGDHAFYECSSLEDVWYQGGIADEYNMEYVGFSNECLKNATWHYNTCVNAHTYSSDCDHLCNDCEWIRVTVVSHVYDNACDDVCNVCGSTRTITHNYEWVIDRQENCGENGTKHEECTICHAKRSEDTVIDATGKHAFDNDCDAVCNVCDYTRTTSHNYEWVIDQQENCGENGSKHEECTICHAKRNENTVINATGKHTFDNACDAVCNVCDFIRAVSGHVYDNACDPICNACDAVRTVPDHSYTRNGNHTCDVCKYSKTPNAPVVENKTNNSVTLIPTDGFEYSKDGMTWQASNVFTNLSAATTYTFYQRVKASTTALVSEASEGTSVTFKSAQAAPSAPIISSFTDTSVSLVVITGCEYSLDGMLWQASNIFTGLSAATKYTFYQRYPETDTHEASNKSPGTSITTDKSKQTQIPDAPTVESFTSSSITLVAVEGCEYSKNGTKWQLSNVFTGLSCGTEYTFYQRYKETTTTYVGKSSDALVAKTDKGTQSKPSAPTLASKTHNTVTLMARSGYEYSRDSVNWQSSNVFTGLEAETNYLFYQRKAETATYYASDASAALTVKTDEEPVYTITFQYEDGTIIAQHTLHYGDPVPVPADPAVPESLGEDYEFVGWDKEVTNCQGDAVYIAVFEQRKSYNGLTLVDGVWGYYEDGVLQTDFTDLVLYEGNFFYVQNGILSFDYTGLVLYMGNYYYVENSVLNWGYTGLTLYNGVWYYVQNGQLVWGYYGLVCHNGAWFYVENSAITFTYTGLVEYMGNWYYVEGSCINWGYSSLYLHNGTWYVIQGGQLIWGYYGLVCYNDLWFYAENSMITFTFTGLAEYQGILFYFEGSCLNWSYNGRATYNGVEYDVVNGMAFF